MPYIYIYIYTYISDQQEEVMKHPGDLGDLATKPWPDASKDDAKSGGTIHSMG